MTDRNSEEQIQKDIEFLNDMLQKLEDPKDICAYEYLKKMLNDWLDELIKLRDASIPSFSVKMAGKLSGYHMSIHTKDSDKGLNVPDPEEVLKLLKEWLDKVK